MVYATDALVVSLEPKQDAHPVSNSVPVMVVNFHLDGVEIAIIRVLVLLVLLEPLVSALFLSAVIMLVVYALHCVDGSVG